MNILILAAHADDEVLGCGATAARLAKDGYKVTPVILCENASVRYDSGMRDNLEEWCRRSSEILGMSEPVFLRHADQKLDTYPSLEMAQVIERAIADFQPEIVFTHHGGDINKDHQVVFEATLVATRPVPGCPVKTVYCYETISSTEWAATEYYSSFRPNVYFDASDTLEMKLKAFGCYTSEIKPYPHPRSIEAIEIRMKDWGSRVGLRAAEAFQLVRSIK